jgi:hypothetical protein
MIGVASGFYRRIHDIVLECLMKRVQKLKKLMNNQNAKISNRCQEKGKKHTHGEMLKGVL